MCRTGESAAEHGGIRAGKARAASAKGQSRLQSIATPLAAREDSRGAAAPFQQRVQHGAACAIHMAVCNRAGVTADANEGASPRRQRRANTQVAWRGGDGPRRA
jgi:hypothetical protein